MKTKQRRSFPPAPTAARALVLRAHPKKDSFNHALANAWEDGASAAGIDVRGFDIGELEFDLRLREAYRQDQPLEPDLVRVRDAIAEAAHLVIAFPMWWASTPAQLKGLFDRVFLPGWAFAYGDGALPVAGLKGRSGRILMTLDAPTWYDTLIYHAAARRQVARGTLGFSGVSPVGVSAFGSVGKSTAEQRAKMLVKARALGVKDGRKFGNPSASRRSLLKNRRWRFDARDGREAQPLRRAPRALGWEWVGDSDRFKFCRVAREDPNDACGQLFFRCTFGAPNGPFCLRSRLFRAES